LLKLTKKADYGLIALRHLASLPGATASTKDIADAYHLPVPLLAKVLQMLTKAKILQSVAGTMGDTNSPGIPGRSAPWKLSGRSMAR